MACLPRLLGCLSATPAGPTLPTKGGQHGKAAFAKKSKREAWLEGEYTRLVKDVRRLATENMDMTRELGGEEVASSPRMGLPPLSVATPPPQPLGKAVGFDLSDEVGRSATLESTSTELMTWQKSCTVSLAAGAGKIYDDMELPSPKTTGTPSVVAHDPDQGGVVQALAGKFNTAVLRGSALTFARPLQAVIYLLAFGGVVLVLLATAYHVGADAEDVAAYEDAVPHQLDAVPHQQDFAQFVPPAALVGGRDGEGDIGPHGNSDHADLTTTTLQPTPRPGRARHGAGASRPEVKPGSRPGDYGDARGEEHGHGHGHARRLFSVAGSSPLMRHITITLTGCGLIALVVNMLKQPLILGYLLGGVLVGPIGLGIVHSHVDISQLSSLGLLFLLFMIGLELDVIALLKMGRVVLFVGFMQFPLCVAMMGGIFAGFEAAGVVSFGVGPYAMMYSALTCGISSTMIVVKLLGEKGEMATEPGKLTIGILIFQDIWAIVILALQPNLANPEAGVILRAFGMMGIVVGIALLYAKFIMPVVLYHTSTNLELMLIMSLAWCFFIGCIATLPFVGLSMELASLIAGLALATFPYSAEFNGKIKYIRDFFITLFFAGLGMQLPVPSLNAILTGTLIAGVVLVTRWLGIYALVMLVGGRSNSKLGTISTINLSQVSEFSLVICSLGMARGHIQDDTMTIIIWTFAILATVTSYMIKNNELIYSKGAYIFSRLRGESPAEACKSDGHEHHHEERDIILLGFHRIAFMLVAEIKAKSPQLLKRIHVIDFNQAMLARLQEVGLTCTYGDISSADVLEHAHHGEPNLVIASIPDSQLRGITNLALVKVSKQVWPNANIIVTAENPHQAQELYKSGADYVVRMAKLCAERLHELLSENRQQVFGGGELADIFEHYKQRDRDLRGASNFIWK